MGGSPLHRLGDADEARAMADWVQQGLEADTAKRHVQRLAGPGVAWAPADLATAGDLTHRGGSYAPAGTGRRRSLPTAMRACSR